MNHVFGPSDRELARAPAIALGIAMQLTNILRDVREDALMGRIYLPSDELADYGLSGVDFSSAEVFRTENWRQYAAFFSKRAQNHYQTAEPGIWLLPDDGSRYCVLCMSRIYGAILDKIQEANWDVSQRRHVPFWEKVFLAFMALNEVRKERVNDNT
jgi:phytoene synthase